MRRDIIVRRRENLITRPIITVVVNVLIYVLLAALILTFAFAVYSKAVGNQVFIGNLSLMWVKTGSMEPGIPAQSYILIKKATADDVKVGDVLTFRSTNPDSYGYVVTHRVTEITDLGFSTKGDANVEVDTHPAERENVIGIYICNLPLLSVLGKSFVKGPGYLIIVVLILITAIAPFVPATIRKYREKLRDKALTDKNNEIEELIKIELERLRAEQEGAIANDNNNIEENNITEETTNTINTEEDHVRETEIAQGNRGEQEEN